MYSSPDLLIMTIRFIQTGLIFYSKTKNPFSKENGFWCAVRDSNP